MLLELKILTENDGGTASDVITPYGGQRSGDAASSGGSKQKPHRSRGPPQRDGEETALEEEEQTKIWT